MIEHSTENERHDETYFARNYRGLYMEDHAVQAGDYRLLVYSCRVCWALTSSPALHERWHVNPPVSGEES